MKIEKLVRITAKSECMDIEVVMSSKKATGYIKKLKAIQDKWIDSVSTKLTKTYRSGRWGAKKTKVFKHVPKEINQKIIIRVEPAGEILN